MTVSEERRGDAFIFLGGVLWAFFPVITVLSYKSVPSLLSLAFSVLFATLFFSLYITYRRKWSELRNPALWRLALAIAFFTGVLYYGFYFTGLTLTTPGNAAIVGLFEVFTSFLLFNVFRREVISINHVIGAVCMLIGAGIVLAKNFSHVNTGDIFILLATCVAPFGNLFQQKARRIASSEAIMFLRSLLSLPALFLLAYVFHAYAPLVSVQHALLFLVINGVLLLGVSKLFWIEAIHRISVTKANALSSITPFLTLLVAWVVLNQAPTLWQIGALIPLVIGVLLLTDAIRLKSSPL